MRGIYSSVTDIRRQVFTEVARMAYEGGDYSRVEELPYKILPGEVSKYRDSIFLERAIVGERLRLSMGLPLRPIDEHAPLSTGIEEAARPETPDSWRIVYPEPVEAALSILPCPRHRGLLLLCEEVPPRPEEESALARARETLGALTGRPLRDAVTAARVRRAEAVAADCQPAPKVSCVFSSPASPIR